MRSVDHFFAVAALALLVCTVVPGSARATSVKAPATSAADSKAKMLGDAVAMLRSAPEAAAAALDPMVGTYPLLADYVLYFDAAAKEPSSPSASRAMLAKLLATYPDSPLAPRAAAQLAPEMATAGRAEELLELSRRFASSPQRDASAIVDLAAARTVLKKDPEQASELLNRVRSVGSTELAASAGELLRTLRAAHPKLRPTTPEAVFTEAVLLGREGRVIEEAALLDRLMREHPDRPAEQRAALLRADLMAVASGPEQAADWLMDLAERTTSARDKARLIYASAVYDWNRNFNTRALAKFDGVIALGTGLVEEQRSYYALGRIHEGARRYTAAASEYRHASEGRDTAVGEECRWRAGWVSYLAGNYSGAAIVFERLAKKSKGASREEALYWQARSLEVGGKDKGAAKLYKMVVKEFPDGFYSYLVERRKGIRAEPPKVAMVRAVEVSGIPQTVATALERSEALHTAGLAEFVDLELSTALPGTDRNTLKRVLPRISKLGAYQQALQISLDLYRDGMLSEQQLYPFLYPHAYADIVKREAKRHGVDAFLAYALMRQESAFNPRAVSSASACGLMQLLPSTAARLSKTPFSDCEPLFDPATNIRLGTAYLGQLAKQFDGNPVLMLAGYNAGEKAAARWRDTYKGLDEDEFIEKISYRETRAYVKKVLRNFRNYRRLYGDGAASLSAERGKQTAR